MIIVQNTEHVDKLKGCPYFPLSLPKYGPPSLEDGPYSPGEDLNR